MINKELQKRIFSSIILIPIVTFFIFQENIFFAFFLIILFLASSYEWIKMNKKDTFKIIGTFYLFFAFFFAYLLREKLSIEIFIFILVICIFTDLGGYVFGKVLKGQKLKKIRQKKTYSVVIGGFILSTIASLIYVKSTFIGSIVFFNLSIWTSNNLESDYIFFLFILFTSFISQLGDLIVSYFKRLARVKDTGNLLPGHGGLLDRLDGIIFAIPMSYFLLTIMK